MPREPPQKSVQIY